MIKILLILFSINIKDHAGREITLKPPIKRIVALSCDIAEIICAIGGEERIVGITGLAKDNSFLPGKIKNLPYCGDWKTVNLEQIIMLAPELVIIGGGGNSYQITKSLESKSIPVLVISPENIYELAQTIELLGKILGCETSAQRLKNFIVAKADYIKALVKNLPKPSVYLAGVNPYCTFAKGSAWSSLIELAGGVNVAGDLDYPWPKISAEILIKWNPEIILIVGNADYETEWFTNKKIFRYVSAVKEGRVYKLGHYLSWSPRIILALIEMAKYIHPDKCKKLELETVENELSKITSIKY